MKSFLMIIALTLLLSATAFPKSDQQPPNSCSAANDAKFNLFRKYKVENGKITWFIADFVVLSNGRICVRKKENGEFEAIPPTLGSDGVLKLNLGAMIPGVPGPLVGIDWLVFNELEGKRTLYPNNPPKIKIFRLNDDILNPPEQFTLSISLEGALYLPDAEPAFEGAESIFAVTLSGHSEVEDVNLDVNSETSDLGAVTFDYRLNDDRKRNQNGIALSRNGKIVGRQYSSDKPTALIPGDYKVNAGSKYDEISFAVRAGEHSTVVIKERRKNSFPKLFRGRLSLENAIFIAAKNSMAKIARLHDAIQFIALYRFGYS